MVCFWSYCINKITILQYNTFRKFYNFYQILQQLKQFKKIHFIGIGGIGISALVYLSLAEGKVVTGSDTVDSTLINSLKEKGAHITIGHDAGNVSDDVELAIYTEAIDSENPELKRAKEMGIPAISYFKALGQISRTKKTIAVVGTHGKTTVTAMLGLSLIESGLDPTVIVGSKLKEFGNRNIYIGKEDLMVVEGCEYRRSFLSLIPFGVVFLNCEAEHLDYYKDEKDYMDAYEELIRQIPSDGFLVANMDDENVKKLTHHCAGRIVPVDGQYAASLDLQLKVIGNFNYLNAAHAYKAAEEVEAEPNSIKKALEDFSGTWRRMEIKGDLNGTLIIDDYGHHPTEIKATLKAIKEHYKDRRIICVFQAHQHSRTHMLLDDFVESFEDADKVLITDIYKVRDSEEDVGKIDGEKFAAAIKKNHSDVKWSGNLDETYKALQDLVETDDVIVTMGAGDIDWLSEKLI